MNVIAFSLCLWFSGHIDDELLTYDLDLYILVWCGSKLVKTFIFNTVWMGSMVDDELLVTDNMYGVVFS